MARSIRFDLIANAARFTAGFIEAQRAVDGLNDKLDRISRKRATPTIDVDVDKPLRSLTRFEGGASRSSRNVGQAFGSISGVFDLLTSNVYVLGAAVALVLAGLPAAAAVAASGIVLGFGGGLAAIGIIAAANTDRVKQAFTGLKDHVVTTVQQLAKPFEPALVQIAGIARRVFDVFAGPLGAAFAKIAPVVVAFADNLGRAFEQLAPVIGPMADAFNALLRAIGPQLPALFGAIASALIQLANTVRGNSKEFATLIIALLQVIPISIRIIAVLAGFYGATVRFISGLVQAAQQAGVFHTVLMITFRVISIAAQVMFGIFKAVFLGMASPVLFLISVVRLLIPVFAAIPGVIRIVSAALSEGQVRWRAFAFAVIGVIASLPGRIAAVFSFVVGVIGRAMAAVGGAISGGFSRAISIVGGAMAAVAGAVAAGFGRVVGVVGGAMVAFGGAIAAGFGRVVGVVAGAMGIVAGAVVAGFGRVVGVVGGAMATFAGAVVAGFGRVVGVVGGAMAAVAGAVAAGFGRLVGLVGGAMAAVGGAVAAAWSRVFAIISGVVGDIFNRVAGGFNAVVAFVGGVFARLQGGVGASWSAVFNTISRVVGDVFNRVAAGFNAVVAFVGGVFTRLQAGVGAAWSAVFNTISRIVGDVFNRVAAGFNAVVAFVGGVFARLQTGVAAAWSAVFSTTSRIVGDVFNRVVAAFNAVLAFVGGIMARLQSGVAAAWSAVFTTISRFVGDVFNRVAQGFNAVLAFVGSILARLQAGVLAAWSAVFATISRLVGDIFNRVAQGWNAILAFIGSILARLQAGISIAWSTIFTTISRFVGDIFNRVAQGWSQMLANTGHNLAAIASTVAGAWSGIFGTISKWVGEIYNRVNGGWNAILGTIKNIGGAIGDAVLGMARTVAGWINKVLNGINSVGGHFGVHVPTIPSFATGGEVAGAISGPGSGTSDSILARLSNGEHVWTAREVANAGGHKGVEMLRAIFGKSNVVQSQHRPNQSGVPGFAAGGGILAGIPSNPLTTIGAFLGKFGLPGGGGGKIGDVVREAAKALARGAFNWAKQKIAEWIARAIAAAKAAAAAAARAAGGLAGAISRFFSGGGNLPGWIAAAMKAAGVSGANWAAGLRVLIMRESGGNPNAINLSDSNARAGHPSQGLAQTIPSTFNAYHVPGTSNNIRDPVANVAAAIRYIQSRYGGIGGVQQANPNASPRGYLSGAWKIRANEVAQLHRGEMVWPPKAADAFRAGAVATAPTFMPGAVTISVASGDRDTIKRAVEESLNEYTQMWAIKNRRRGG